MEFTQPSFSSVLTRPLIPIHATHYQAPPTSSQTPHVPVITEKRAASRPLPLHSLLIPDIPLRHSDGSRSHMSNSWREIVEHWTNGDPARGLHTPLKDWPRKWLTKENKLFAQKHGNRGIIALEFLVK